MRVDGMLNDKTRRGWKREADMGRKKELGKEEEEVREKEAERA